MLKREGGRVAAWEVGKIMILCQNEINSDSIREKQLIHLQVGNFASSDFWIIPEATF